MSDTRRDGAKVTLPWPRVVRETAVHCRDCGGDGLMFIHHAEGTVSRRNCPDCGGLGYRWAREIVAPPADRDGRTEGD
jgi:hypothetical protein